MELRHVSQIERRQMLTRASNAPQDFANGGHIETALDHKLPCNYMVLELELCRRKDGASGEIRTTLDETIFPQLTSYQPALSMGRDC